MKLGSITIGGGGVVVGGLLILKSVEYRSEYGSVGTAFSGLSLGLLCTVFLEAVVVWDVGTVSSVTTGSEEISLAESSASVNVVSSSLWISVKSGV